MVRAVDAATATELQARGGLIRRDLVWITAKNRATGAPESIGLWNGADHVDISVVSGETGATVTRPYYGMGGLQNVPAIPLVSDLTVRKITISFSQLDPAILKAVREYDPRHAPVEVHRLYLNRETRLPIAPAVPRFLGFVNTTPIERPKANSEGSIRLEVVSHTRVLTRKVPAKKSDEYQRQRGGDRFYKFTDVSGQWEIAWGEKSGPIG
ncbi:hypothetical protein [Nitratireductor indicus]|uniref:hypothetical protein n=1 Tax=Nitratireductor indicus TaxID=721133 RepID=UPI0028748C49|nr:hypothetical protein [Nitratireductor indicus]MDS1135561.1 hypothetical protein [Nitratireductor indicus]